MNKSLKAVLLSALVYPGAGHFFLKKYAMCIALVSVFSVPLFLLISEIVGKANIVVKQIENGEIPLNIAAISESLSSIISDTYAQDLNIKIYVIAAAWLIGILDSYRVSKLKT